MTRTNLPIVLMLFLALPVAACGGGGGASAPATPAPVYALDGAYGMFTFEGLTANLRMRQDSARMAWGRADADAATGALDVALAEHLSRSSALTLDQRARTYTPLPDGRLRVENFVGYASGTAAPAEVAALAAESNAPGISLLVKRPVGGVPLSPADFAGDYHIAIFSHDDAPDAETLRYGSLTLDGAGVATNVWLRANHAGTLSPGSMRPGGTYAVGADGAFGLTLDGLQLSGIALGSRQLIVLGGAMDVAAGIQALGFLIPVATASSDATLSGRYAAVGIDSLRTTGFAPTSPHFISSLSSFDADGAGSLTLLGAYVVNEDGSTRSGSGATATSPYAMAPVGVFTLGHTGLFGYLSPDGRFGLFLGAGAGEAPTLSFLLRLP